MYTLTIERIKSLSIKHNVSVAIVLKDTGINPGFLTDLGRKPITPSADKLVKIADYFNVSVDYLLGRTDKPEVNK